MIVGLLTPEQKEEINGKQFAADSYFNPIQDADNNWVISIQEIEQSTAPFEWLKEITLIEFKPKF